MFSNGYLILSLALGAIGFIVQRILISKMHKYGAQFISRGMSGKQIAEDVYKRQPYHWMELLYYTPSRAW